MGDGVLRYAGNGVGLLASVSAGPAGALGFLFPLFFAFFLSLTISDPLPFSTPTICLSPSIRISLTHLFNMNNGASICGHFLFSLVIFSCHEGKRGGKDTEILLLLEGK